MSEERRTEDGKTMWQEARDSAFMLGCAILWTLACGAFVVGVFLWLWF